MRILYLSQYFPPEAGATQTRAYEMAYNWVHLGHQVTMLTEFPNHPSGIIPQEYQGKFYERSSLNGIEVIRLWVKASPVKNFSNRMLFYLTYMFNAIIAGLFLARGRYQLIYASSPPLFVGGAALVLRLIKRTPLVFEVRDLWPESAIALGELTNARAISIATRLEEECYRKAIQVVVVTRGIFNRLKARSISTDKILFVPNGANIDLFRFNPEGRERIRKELGLEGKFIAVYAGIHGLAQGLETLLETASQLQDITDIHILLIGDGPKKADIVSLANQLKLPNLTLLPEKARDQIPDYLSAADVALIPLRKLEIFKGALPSKIFDAWACDRPVIISVDGEAREIVELINGGVFIPPEDPNRLAEAIIRLKNTPDERLIMGKNGLIYTRQNHSREVLAQKLIIHLEKILNP
jgi:glycosyltransferase involved in cell wall biosynthesis